MNDYNYTMYKYMGYSIVLINGNRNQQKCLGIQGNFPAYIISRLASDSLHRLTNNDIHCIYLVNRQSLLYFIGYGYHGIPMTGAHSFTGGICLHKTFIK